MHITANQTYFINSLSVLQISQARAAGIMVLDYGSGILVTENDLGKLLRCLGLKITGRAATGYAGITKIIVTTGAKSPRSPRQRTARIPTPRTNRDRYITLCQQWRTQARASGRQQLLELRRRVTELQEELTAAVGALTRAEYAAGDNASDQRDRYGAEYDRLLALPQVTRVEVTTTVIKIFTDVLFCTDPRTDTVHEIGKFRIDIYPSGNNDGVRWHNLTRRVNGLQMAQHAPHIFAEGRACLGNMLEVIPQLLGKHEFALVASMAIAFVESVNVNDGAGMYVDRWPRATQAALARRAQPTRQRKKRSA